MYPIDVLAHECTTVFSEQGFTDLANSSGLHKQFRKWAKKHHPDKNINGAELYEMVNKCMQPKVLKRLYVNSTDWGKFMNFITADAIFNQICFYTAAYIVIPISLLSFTFLTEEILWYILVTVEKVYVNLKLYAHGYPINASFIKNNISNNTDHPIEMHHQMSVLRSVSKQRSSEL